MRTPSVSTSSITGYHDTNSIDALVDHVLSAAPQVLERVLAAGRRGLVVVKPNWVQESHEYRADVWEPVITHPHLIMSVVRVMAEIMKGYGTICICDAPHGYAAFSRLIERGLLRTQLAELARKWPRLSIELVDLRREVMVRREEVVVDRKVNPPDPRGYAALNLGKDSLFYNFRGEGRYYGADYDSRVVNSHHNGDTHEYLLAGSPMRCDLFINLPKLKTHKKTGITCSLKNLVGINGDKNWLPHHTEGHPSTFGDEYPTAALANALEHRAKNWGRRIALRVPRIGTWMYRKARRAGKTVLGDSQRTIRNGNWIGNDTCWRMALDLNRAFLYGNADGSWREADAPRPYITIVDGIVGGQGDGPLCPDPAPSGVLIGGTDPACVDAVAARLMGFEPDALPIVRNAFVDHRWPISCCSMSDIVVLQHGRATSLSDVQPSIPGGFQPHFGWKNLQRVA